MKAPEAPKLEQRRTLQFDAELQERAQAWIPSWGLADGERDFGRALLKIAARFSSEVAERLDGAGEKMRRGFLDWLAVRGKAPRPARMPVVFKLADAAQESVLAQEPVRLQVDAGGTPVFFETEADVRLVPGRLDAVVGVDASGDAFYLAPPGLESLDPLEPAPTQWRLKTFAAAGATKLQLDPEQGLTPDMIVEAGGKQYLITFVDKDIATVEPALEAELRPETTTVRKVTTFAPFDGAAHNWQEHALYLGDMDLLNIEAAATIDVVGAKILGEDVTWQYWGKLDQGDEVGWQPLTLAKPEDQQADALVLKKPKGAVEPREIGAGNSSRWIRAFKGNVERGAPLLQVDALDVRVNCKRIPAPCPIDAPQEASPAADAMANTTPLALDSVFFPLGREPRQFDAFYLGIQEAFTKKGAQIQLCFEMADLTFTTLSAVREGPFANRVLSGVARDRALHLLQFNAYTRTVTKFREREPLQPPLPGFNGQADSRTSVALDRRPPWRLPMWSEGEDFLVAATAGGDVWVWHEKGLDRGNSGWRSFGQLPAVGLPPSGPVDGLVYLGDTASDTAPQLAALRDGVLALRACSNGAQWNPVDTLDGSNRVVLKSIVPVLVDNGSGQLVTSAAAGMVGISDTNKLYSVSTGGACVQLHEASNFAAEIRPAAVIDGQGLVIMAVDKCDPPQLIASSANRRDVDTFTIAPGARVIGALEVILRSGKFHVLASVIVATKSYLASWIPFDGQTTTTCVEISIPANLGHISGAPTALDHYVDQYVKHHVVIPGARADDANQSGIVLFTQPEGLNQSFPTVNAVPGEWSWLLGDTSTNPELSWEYWNGKGWWKLDVTSDETLHLRTTGAVRFKVPNDIASSDWAGKTNHWIRARLIGGDYGRERITMAPSPTRTPGVAQPTVERSSEDIRAPSVVKLHIAYGSCEGVRPTFLLAQDSGSIRDQSDANRTTGAIVEAFVPLAVSLGRLSGAAASSQAPEDCPPDCDCPSSPADTISPSSSAMTLSIEIPPPTSGRSLLIGFRAALSEGPVNVLLLVEERRHEQLAPMKIEALVADRFVPIVASDATRALGESGLISMTFAVKPTPRELFGKTLSWLRLTPAARDSADKWKPVLRGAYLNAVWASAAETLTRELLGSSDGAPNLRLFLARPPVLRDTLELRVKEPLGEEELKALTDRDQNLVRSTVENLPGDWVLWKRVIDPDDEPATARVYALDEANGEVRFGDSRHGAIPPIGRDSIVAFQYRHTEAGTAGSDLVPGNSIVARTPLNLVSSVESVEAAFAADQAAGGAPAEADERVLRFGTARLRHRNRAVTAADFEDLALQSSPDIAQARCFTRPGRVRLVVVMRGNNPQPNAAQSRELRRLLLAAAPASLAVSQALQITGPKVRRLRIALTLLVASLDHTGEVSRNVKQRITLFFDTAMGGVDKDGWALGENPGEEDLALALLDTPHLEGLAQLTRYEITVDSAERPWTGTVKRDELVMLDEDALRIQFETAEAIP